MKLRINRKIITIVLPVMMLSLPFITNAEELDLSANNTETFISTELTEDNAAERNDVVTDGDKILQPEVTNENLLSDGINEDVIQDNSAESAEIVLDDGEITEDEVLDSHEKTISENAECDEDELNGKNSHQLRVELGLEDPYDWEIEGAKKGYSELYAAAGENCEYKMTKLEDGTYKMEISGTGAIDYDILTRYFSTYNFNNKVSELYVSEGITLFPEYPFTMFRYLKKIVIPSTITELAQQFFSGMSGLKTMGGIGSGCDIEIAMKEIPAYSFANCYLETIDVPECVTKLGKGCFSYNKHLKTLTIHTELKYDENTFYACNSKDGCPTIILPNAKYCDGYAQYGDNEVNFLFLDDIYPTQFTDVPANTYYVDAVKWAVNNSITNGTSSTTFSPTDSCTRAQVVTFLWRSVGSPSVSITSVPFSDVDSGKYYYKALLWAYENGIAAGTGNGKFEPDATVTRGQFVTFLYRTKGRPAASGGTSFSDVASSAYYANSVMWAAANGVTTGTGNNCFSPNAACTRAQVVTFLYRARAL